MFSGFYTAASGVLMNQRALNISANNIANVKTSGYQSKRLVKTTFDEQLVRQMNGQTTGIGGGSTISVAEREMTTHRQGALVDTGKNFDMAISGDGLFVIQGEDRQYLTRNGHFTQDEDGYLVLKGIGRVMGDGGPIQVEEGGFRVGENGIIYDSEDGELAQVYPEVYQGKLEESGVNLNSEMTRAMEVQRAFQSCSRALTIVDQMNQKSASEIGKL